MRMVVFMWKYEKAKGEREYGKNKIFFEGGNLGSF